MENDTFVLPDEYKDVQAVQGCHSVADLCKKVVDNESFIGKLKSERAMPTENDGDDVWNTFFGKTKAVAEKQDWADISPEFAKVAKDAGLVKQQAKPILDFINAENDKKYDEEAFKQLKAEKFKGKESSLTKIDAMLSKVSKESIDGLLDIDNENLIKVYSAFAEIADNFGINESKTPPASANQGKSNNVYNADGSLNAEALNNMQDELLAVPNVPNKQELREAIFKKYGY